MKPNPRLLDEIDIEVVNRTPTVEERKEMSAFIQKLKREEKLKAQRKAARKTQTATV